MAMKGSICKSGLWILAIYVIVSLHGADAQTNVTTSGPLVPGWGIALLVLMCLFLAAIMICVCCAPFCCRAGADGVQGMGSVFNNLKCWS